MTERVEDLRNHRKKLVAVADLVIAVGMLIVLFYWSYKSTHISTDDAFVEGRIDTIASKVAGTSRGVRCFRRSIVLSNVLFMPSRPDAALQAPLPPA